MQTPQLVAGVTESPDRRVLGTVTMPGVALAVWHRAPAPGFQAWLDAVAAERLPELRTTIWPGEVGRAVQRACERAGTPDGWRLVAPCETLAQAASEAMGTPLLDVRLRVVVGTDCPKWHIDATRCRLLCTLRGPGTEYGAASPSRHVPEEVFQLPTGAAALFRGLLWPGPEFPAIVHRSPAGSAARLLVVIDPVDGTRRH